MRYIIISPWGFATAKANGKTLTFRSHAKAVKWAKKNISPDLLATFPYRVTTAYRDLLTGKWFHADTLGNGILIGTKPRYARGRA
ncbi:hypothetical protein SEA_PINEAPPLEPIZZA_19 [Microbacterium phage PineapplePizza]|uniref:Uncharacterized protein n=1 Tax=Microbacterium phage PineapplePizza TaxID=2927268 RepID=A0A976YCJ0_9CAUD|nr:hypothetical protein QEH41_gp19 [Microbacterium phage PineapplePizza]UVF60427.1 hypothetical protein SEA_PINEAPPLEPIZZA_19 [Microbacterium phage PineapplePizza]